MCRSSIACRWQSFAYAGIAVEGHLKFVSWYGELEVNSRRLSTAGDAFWLVGGADVSVRAKGAVGFYVIGSEFRLVRGASSAITSSYNASRGRLYGMLDAIRGEGGKLVHDEHIGNGTTNAADIIFSAGESCVEPPHIVVLNCAPTSESYVWYHSHPQGALYVNATSIRTSLFNSASSDPLTDPLTASPSRRRQVPLAGRLCFLAGDGKRCVEPGFPRWTSPNLFCPSSPHRTAA